MECMDGETPGERLEKGRLSLEHVLKYGAQIAVRSDGLSQLPKLRVVPRSTVFRSKVVNSISQGLAVT